MNTKVMRMLYSDGSNVTDMRMRNARGRFMEAYGGNTSRMIGYGEQDTYDRSMMHPMDTMDDGRGGMGLDHTRERMTMGMGNTQAKKKMQMGASDIEEYIEKPLTIGEAMHWAENLPEGPKWKTDDVKQYAQKAGMSTSGKEFAEFYAVMNALHSDFHKALSKYGVTDPQAYADLACAFINDEDAVENKSAVYYRFIVDDD